MVIYFMYLIDGKGGGGGSLVYIIEIWGSF